MKTLRNLSIQHHQCSVILLSLAAALCSPAVSQAALEISFSADGSDPGFVSGVGSTVIIPVYARQTSPTTTLSVDGMTAFGFSANWDPTLGRVSEVNVQNFVAGDINSTTNGLVEVSGFVFPPPLGTNVTGEAILLANISFMPSATRDIQFSVGDRDAAVPNFTSGQTVLDEEFFGAGSANTFTTTVSAVPEPGSMLLLSAVGGCFAYSRRRRRAVA